MPGLEGLGWSSSPSPTPETRDGEGTCPGPRRGWPSRKREALQHPAPSDARDTRGFPRGRTFSRRRAFATPPTTSAPGPGALLAALHAVAGTQPSNRASLDTDMVPNPTASSWAQQGEGDSQRHRPGPTPQGGRSSREVGPACGGAGPARGRAGRGGAGLPELFLGIRSPFPGCLLGKARGGRQLSREARLKLPWPACWLKSQITAEVGWGNNSVYAS